MQLRHRNRLLGARRVLREAEKAYGKAIRELIAEGVSQKDISELLHVSPSTLSRQYGRRRKG